MPTLTEQQARTKAARETAIANRKKRMHDRLASQLREAGYTVIEPKESK